MTEPDLTGLDDPDAELIAARIASWPSDRKAEMLDWLKDQARRVKLRKQYDHPAQLAAAIDPGYKITPAISLISRSVERVIREPRRNLLVTMPPQEGKSDLCAVWTPLRALQLDPNTRVVVTAYGDALAEEHSSKAQSFINQAGTGAVDMITGQPLPDRLGLSLNPNRRAVGRWNVEGGRGGMVAVGLGSAITGRAADLLVIDDPYKNQQEADSVSHRRKVEEWLRAVAFTRLSADASVILIQTRWHPEDLAGMIMRIENEADPVDRTWRHLNIPAVAEVGVKDDLHRQPGVFMVSAGGKDAAFYRAQRAKVGERAWYAMYQGQPAPPEGGLFARHWFDDFRITPENPAKLALMAHPVLTLVAVDPAESGEGDEAGIIGAALLSDQTKVLTHDRSGQMTSSEWGEAAVDLALEINARELAVESYTTATTYTNVIKSAFRRRHEESVAKHAAGEELSITERRALRDMPFKIVRWRQPGNSVERSAALRSSLETGTTRVMGSSMAELEEQAVTWQDGQHQPDRVAAAVIAENRLTSYGGGGGGYGSPLTSAARPTGQSAWLQRRIG